MSDNSSRVVSIYLERHDLADGVSLIAGRTSRSPELLKPNPHLINAAIHGLDADSAATTLVGDSLSDVEAAHRAGVNSIGYPNGTGKRERMADMEAGAVITSMSHLALALRAR